MIKFDKLKGVTVKVHKFRLRSFAAALLAMSAIVFTSCSDPAAGPTGNVDPQAVAARINGKEIKYEEVEKGVKAQAQGQEASLSPLELASARLSVLQSLIQTEVMFQKAEKESALPTDDEVTTAMNKRRTESGLSSEEFQKQMEKAGETEASWRLNVKKELALQKLQEKITGKVDSPKDKEIEDFYNGNKEQFKNKRGAQLAAIVIDPTNTGQGDPTTNMDEANAKAKEVGQKALTPGMDFASLAREYSEDLQTRSNGGDWRYFSEDEMKQTFGDNVTNYVMNQAQNGQVIPTAIPLEGKVIILKLQRKQDKDEDLTLESPTVRPRITEMLVNARKNLLWQSYTAIAINEAKVENFLAKRVVDNPNDLSGARPAGAVTPPPANASSSNTNANAANANAPANSAANAKPASNTPANAAAVKPANANANGAK